MVERRQKEMDAKAGTASLGNSLHRVGCRLSMGGAVDGESCERRTIRSPA